MIGLIFIGNVSYCPYISKYIKILEENGKKFEVLFWNRESTLDVYPSNYFSFNKASVLKKHPVRKIKEFIQFSMWVRKKVKERKYEKVILLSTLSGMVIYDILLKQYKNRYIFDIRDYSYENINIFLKLEEQVIKNSYFTCISSEGFKNFLPKGYNYIIAHNFRYEDLKYEEKYSKIDKNKKVLKLAWIGLVRLFDLFSKEIEILKDDERFELYFYGDGLDYERLKKFVADNNIKNVFLKGRFTYSEKNNILNQIDIINNLYDTQTNVARYAISNKFYDGIIYKIPQIVGENSVYSKNLEQEKIVYKWNLNTKNDIDKNVFEKNCNMELKKILKEDKKYIKYITDFINYKI